MFDTQVKRPRSAKDAVLLLLDIMLAVMLIIAASPAQSIALDTAKCTARANSDEGNDVMGGSNTRITWEATAGEDEQLTQLTITVPDGTDFDVSKTKVTFLTGDDLMTRETPDVTCTADGTTITVDFAEPSAAGIYVRVEIFDVFFPASGGQMQLTGTYTTADGEVHQIDDIPAIDVVGITPAEQLGNQLAQQDWVKAWNSNKFLFMFFNPTLIVTSFPVVFNGFLMALAIVAVAFPVAIPFGLILSFMRMSRFKVLRGLASLYVNVVRGTPLFLQIYIAFFGLPLAGIHIPEFPLGVIVLAMNSCAYQCEIYRAGIQSINKGQFEAARSLGMTGAQTMAYVIIPQTVRRVLPTLTNEFILLYKDTSMLAAVGVMEVVMYAKTIVASTGSITPYIVAAIFYLVITLPLAKLVGSLEKKLAANDTGGSQGSSKKTKKKSRRSKNDADNTGTWQPDATPRTGVSPEEMSSL